MAVPRRSVRARLFDEAVVASCLSYDAEGDLSAIAKFLVGHAH